MTRKPSSRTAVRRIWPAVLLSALSLALLAGCAPPAPEPGTYPDTAPPAPAAPVIDQEQPTIDATVGGLAIGGASEQMLAQVVTAGMAGQLRAVLLPVACGSGDLTLQVQGVSAGQPDVSVRVTTAIPGGSLPGFHPGPPEFRRLALAAPSR